MKKTISPLLLHLSTSLSILAFAQACSTKDDCEDVLSCERDESSDDASKDSSEEMSTEKTLSCATEEIACEGACIDPETDVSFCGASGTCSGSQGGDTCGEDEECRAGECVPVCEEAQLLCDGSCIDPLTDASFCGASDGCAGSNAGVLCDASESCQAGRCVGWFETARDLPSVEASKVMGAIDASGNRIAVWQEVERLGISYFETEEAEWGEAQYLSIENGGTVRDFEFGMSADGISVVNWSQDVGALHGQHVVAGPGPVLGAPASILGGDSYDEFFLSPVVSNEAGQAVSHGFHSRTEGQVVGPIFGHARFLSEDGAWERPSGYPSFWSVEAAPLLAMDGEGNALLVYEARPGGTFSEELRCLTRSPGESWSVCQDLVIPAGAPGTQIRWSRLRMNSAGQAALLWHRQESLGSGLYALPRDVEGDWGARQVVVDIAPEQLTGTDMEIAQDGSLLVVWSDDVRVKLRRYDATNEEWDEAVILADSPGASGVQLALNETGDAVVAWSQDGETHKQTVALKYDAESDTWESAPTVLAETFDHDAILSSLEINSLGEIFATGMFGTRLWYNAFTHYSK